MSKVDFTYYTKKTVEFDKNKFIESSNLNEKESILLEKIEIKSISSNILNEKFITIIFKDDVQSRWYGKSLPDEYIVEVTLRSVLYIPVDSYGPVPTHEYCPYEEYENDYKELFIKIYNYCEQIKENENDENFN